MHNILLAIVCLIQTTVYSYSVNSIDGNNISFNNYQGKKILIVNVATESRYANQLASLQQLRQQYGDSLVIIAVPSNSFGHESKNNAAIKQACINQINAGIVFMQKSDVTGSTALPLCQWLIDAGQSGDMASPILSDFQKFLINKNGELVGVFSPVLDPMSAEIQRAINMP